MRTAIVFPGMGPTRFTDVDAFMLGDPVARRLVARADEVLGYSLADRFRDSEDDYSEAAQVAFLVNSLALAEWAERTLDIAPHVCAGPSFGGKAAAAYSGALSFPDAVRMTAELARCTADYFAHEHRDLVTCSFVRVPEEKLRELLAELRELGEWHDVSCYIDHDFYMVTVRDGRRCGWKAGSGHSAGCRCTACGRPCTRRVRSRCARGPRRRCSALCSFADPRLPVVDDHDGTAHRRGGRAGHAARRLRPAAALARGGRHDAAAQRHEGRRQRPGRHVRPGAGHHAELHRGPGEPEDGGAAATIGPTA